MKNATRDDNFVTAIQGVSSVDSSEVKDVLVSPSSGGVLVEIASDTSVSGDFEGGPVSVGTTPVELTFTGSILSLQIQADHDNAGSIWFGKSDIDSSGANAVGRLEAGESVQMDIDGDSNSVYVVASQADQKVFKLGLI